MGNYIKYQIPVIDICSSYLIFSQIFIGTAFLTAYISFASLVAHEMHMKFKLILYIVVNAKKPQQNQKLTNQKTQTQTKPKRRIIKHWKIQTF